MVANMDVPRSVGLLYIITSVKHLQILTDEIIVKIIIRQVIVIFYLLFSQFYLFS